MINKVLLTVYVLCSILVMIGLSNIKQWIVEFIMNWHRHRLDLYVLLCSHNPVRVCCALSVLQSLLCSLPHTVASATPRSTPTVTSPLLSFFYVPWFSLTGHLIFWDHPDPVNWSPLYTILFTNDKHISFVLNTGARYQYAHVSNTFFMY